MTNIKFEGAHDDLKDLHHFLYAKDKSLVIEENYQTAPGVNKAPDLIELIIPILSSIMEETVRGLVKEYFESRKAKREKIKASVSKDDGPYELMDDVSGARE